VLALLGFLFAFAPDLTGYAVHEWLGLAVGVVLLIHLLQHWKWIKSVTQRIGRTKQKILVRYIIDTILLLSFFAIIATGIIISLILNLPLKNYEAWRLIHVLSSYGTLVMIGFKIALHWDWIVKQVKKISMTKIGKTRQITDVAKESRRNFLRTGLITSAAAVIAIVEFKAWQTKTSGVSSFVETLPIEEENDQFIQPVKEITIEPTNDSQQSTATITQDVEENSNVAVTATIQHTATPIPTEEAVTGVVRCNRNCSYPGKCSRYQDDNENGKCDLGEPIW